VELKHHERKKATYTKRKLDYWEDEIHQKRKEQRASLASTSMYKERVEDNEISDESPTRATQDYNKMTIAQLKEVIKRKKKKVKNITKFKKKRPSGSCRKFSSTINIICKLTYS